eukprot:874010-Pyramimonas_sp.AAC.1
MQRGLRSPREALLVEWGPPGRAHGQPARPACGVALACGQQLIVQTSHKTSALGLSFDEFGSKQHCI